MSLKAISRRPLKHAFSHRMRIKKKKLLFYEYERHIVKCNSPSSRLSSLLRSSSLRSSSQRLAIVAPFWLLSLSPRDRCCRCRLCRHCCLHLRQCTPGCSCAVVAVMGARGSHWHPGSGGGSGVATWSSSDVDRGMCCSSGAV